MQAQLDLFQEPPAPPAEPPCKHPPTRLYMGNWYDPEAERYKTWLACCQCGEVLTDDFMLRNRKNRKKG